MSNKDFKQLLREKLKEMKPKINDNSLRVYTNNIVNLIEKYNLNLRDLLNKPEEIIKILNNDDKITDATKKNYYVILSILTKDKEEEYKKYREQLDKYNGKYKDVSGKTEKFKEKTEGLNYKDLLKVYEDYKNEYIEYLKLDKLTGDLYFKVQLLLILMLLMDEVPNRNDLRNVQIIRKGKEKDNENNYYIAKTGEFIYNKYKTAKTNGQIKFKVKPDIKKYLDRWIKINSTNYLFTDKNYNPMSSAEFTNRLTTFFKKKTGKNISTTILRHLSLSDKYKEIKEEMKEVAHKYGHSTQTQQNIYVN